MNRVFEAQGEVVTRRLSLLYGALVLMFVGLGLVVWGVPVWAPFVEEALGVAMLVAFVTNAYPVRWRGTVRADRTGISLDGRAFLARPRIAATYVLSLAEPAVRVAPRHGLPFDIRVGSDAEAGALVDALGFGIGESIATFRALAGKRSWLTGVIMAIVVGQGCAALAIFALHRAGPWPAILAGLVVTAASLFVHQARAVFVVDVGSDGILLRRLGDLRFLRFDALGGVTTEGGVIVLQLRSGESVRLGVGTSRELIESGDALVRRIEEARTAVPPTKLPDGADGLLAPGGRPFARWVRELRALASAHDYREARMDSERLWTVLSDATASPAMRAGAAIALSEDEPSRERVRVAADACAEPRLRVALTRVAEGAADALLEEALAPLLETKK